MRLGGRMAGVLFLLAGLTVPLLMVLPGGTSDHWQWIAAFCAGCLAWGVCCLTLIDFERVRPAVFLVPAAVALVLVAAVMACTGGAESPARFYLFFVLVYVAAFYPPRQAYPLLVGCVVVEASPLAYDPVATEGQFVGELLVAGFAYLVLGMVLLQGKALLAQLRADAQELALHDPLTGLANRRAMMSWLQSHLTRGDEPPLGLVLVDLDGFKDVNTLHGYQEGDRVLCEAARALEGCSRTDDLVARLGGDEFALLVSGSHIDEVGQVGGQLLECMRDMNDRLALPGVRVTASVGWVVYPHDAGSIEELVKIADVCLRGAKAAGKDRAISPGDRAPTQLVT
jgi:diguanylate cyclase (GGDEF)-like protein